MSTEDRLWAELNVGGLDYQSGDPLNYEEVVTRVAAARQADRTAPLIAFAKNYRTWVCTCGTLRNAHKDYDTRCPRCGAMSEP